VHAADAVTMITQDTQLRGAPQGAANTFGTEFEGALPVSRDAGAAVGTVPRKKRSPLAIAARILRNAAIAVALMTAVPIAIVGLNGHKVWGRIVSGGNTHVKTVIAERVRQYALPKDPSITPMQAGLAYNALQAPRDKPTPFVEIKPAYRPERTWEKRAIASGTFLTARSNLYKGIANEKILEAVSSGFSPEEKAYLRVLATAPVWREFDLIGRAQAVDIIGGRFVIPFAKEATWAEMPITKFAATKELAYASLSRAAWHMSIGQRDSAEAALRSVISFGFAMVDNGTSLIDQLIGDVVVGIGRDGLQRFYTVTGDPRATDPSLALPKPDELTALARESKWKLSNPEEARRTLISRVADPKLPRGERFEALRMLSTSSCTNVRELLTGPRSDVTEAIDRARRDLARFPSERAYIDLSTQLPVVRYRDVSYNPFLALLASTSSVASVALNNPRMTACPLIASP
jgi:hypothetical protein